MPLIPLIAITTTKCFPLCLWRSVDFDPDAWFLSQNGLFRNNLTKSRPAGGICERRLNL